MGGPWQSLRAVARVLITNEAGELLLCRSHNGKAWVPPGGTLDPGETLPIAAVREAQEEAGLTVRLGALAYMQEFRPGGRSEHVIETAFHAIALADHPPETVAGVRPAGGAGRPWEAWFIQDPFGPVREVRWFSREALAAVREPVYPGWLQSRYWEERQAAADRYLGVVLVK